MDRLGLIYLKAADLSPEGKKYLERYITGDGVIVGWGLCRDGELGTGSRYNLLTPLMIGGLDKPIRMACCGLSSTWIGVHNVIVTMGSGMWGELAVGNPRFCPRVVANEMNMPICVGQVDVSPVSLNDTLMVDVSAGFAYVSCVSIKGEVYAWGANNYGQCHPDLCNACCGFAQPRVIPNELVVQVACANFAVVARTLSGAVYGWGLSMLLGEKADLQAQCGSNGTIAVKNSPDRHVVPLATRIMALDALDVTLVRAGPWHFVALTRDGAAYSWGLGNNGRLGHGDASDRTTPTVVAALRKRRVVDVVCGSFHTVFVTEDGEALACGDNQGGQCGVVGLAELLQPTALKVVGDRRVIQAGAGRHHTALLLGTGEVVVYGTGVGLGIGLGYGIRMVRCQPVMANYTSLWLSSGPSHNFALAIPKNTSMLVLGVPHRGVNAALTYIGLKEGIMSCGCGAGFTIMVSRRGSCYAFGVAGWAQLGFDTSQAKDFTPERVPVIPQATRVGYFARSIITYVAAGFSFSMAITEGERVFAWGNNSYSQCGLGVSPKKYQRISEPREITWLSDKEIIQVACGSYFALALSCAGDVYSWGTIECCGHGLEPAEDVVPPHMIMRNMGKESKGVILSPTKVLDLSCIVAIAAGGWHALALNAIGEIYAWGIGTGGRLGLGSSEHSYTPTRIEHSAFFTRIGCGCYTSYAIDDDAKLYLWGVNDKLQLGVRGKVNTPTMVLENVREACLGKYFTLALTYANTFHLSGTLECDTSTYKSSSFDDVESLPGRLKPDNLNGENLKGIRLFGGLEHAIILLEKDPASPEVITEVTTELRQVPEKIIAANAKQ